MISEQLPGLSSELCLSTPWGPCPLLPLCQLFRDLLFHFFSVSGRERRWKRLAWILSSAFYHLVFNAQLKGHYILFKKREEDPAFRRPRQKNHQKF